MFLALAKIVASRSTCLSRHYGAIIVKEGQIISTGYNGSLPGHPHCLDDGKCFKRQLGQKGGEWQYCRASHAERNAIYLAAKKGISTEGSVIYISAFPCEECLKAIVMAGIKEIVFDSYYDVRTMNEFEEYVKQVRAKNKIKLTKIMLNSEDLARLNMHLNLSGDHKFLK